MSVSPTSTHPNPIPTSLALPSSSLNALEPITRTISFGSMPSRTPSLNPITRTSSRQSSNSSSTRSLQERRRSGTPNPNVHSLTLDLSDSQSTNVVHNATAPLPRTPYPQSPFPLTADGEEEKKKWKIWKKARWAGLCSWGRRRRMSGEVEVEK